MSQETTPTQPQPARTASPEKKALLEAFDTVLKTRPRRKPKCGTRRRGEAARGRVRPWLWTSAVCTMVLCVYLLVERPEWLFPRSPRPGIGRGAGGQSPDQHGQRRPAHPALPPAERPLPETLTEAGANSAGSSTSRTATG